MNGRNQLPTTTTTQTETEELRDDAFGAANVVVERYLHCSFCGANLHFVHVTDFARNMTQETAKCPECGVQARQVLHRLQ